MVCAEKYVYLFEIIQKKKGIKILIWEIFK